MICLQRTWTQARQLMIESAWQTSEVTKTKWIAEMDDLRNIDARITLLPHLNCIELEFERALDGLVYRAGKTLTLNDFESFMICFTQL